MNNLETFKRNAAERNLCTEYALKWQGCKTKEDLFCLSLIPQSIPYMAISTYEGWGLSIDYLKSEVKDYINGKYIVKDLDGVVGATASFHVGCRNLNIKEINTVMHLMDCNKCKISIQDYHSVKLHISNNSNVNIETGVGYIVINVYDNSIVDLGIIKKGTTVNVVKLSDNSKVIFTIDGGICNIRKKHLSI